MSRNITLSPGGGHLWCPEGQTTPSLEHEKLVDVRIESSGNVIGCQTDCVKLNV